MGERRPRRGLPERPTRAEVDEELSLHVEERVREYVALGMDPEAARERALARFGDVERVRDACERELAAERRGRKRREWLTFSTLDFKLGLRMLVKHPGLTVVGGLAMAFAIAVGALAFEFGAQLVHPTLPLPDGDRLVAIRLWHAGANGVEEQALFDFAAWRGSLESVEELGAWRAVNRNLVEPDGGARPVRVAEMTASGFRVAGVRPLSGRPLADADEETGAPPVLVIGERLWRTHFGARPDIVGREVSLGRERSTVVGVMPESFRFPVSHGAWAPLRVEELVSGPREGSPVNVFGRLAAGTTLEEAQAELAVLGQRAAADLPDTHAQLRPQVIPYARSIFPVPWSVVTGFAYSGQLAVVLFLVLVCANVATLVFARTAAREGEMVVRSALGASRGRIAMQLLAETLVLAAAATLVGLPVARLGMRTATTFVETVARPLPFWVSGGISPTTVAYAVALATLAAVVAGVVPALKVTRGMADRLRQAGAGGGGLRFGRVWSGLIATQIALTVIFMAAALDTQEDASRARALELGVPGDRVLHAKLQMHRATAVSETAEVPYTDEERARFRATFEELRSRLAAEPEVAGVSYGYVVPGMYHGLAHIDVEAPVHGAGAGGLRTVQVGTVAAGYFDALGIRLTAGRAFRPSDVPEGSPLCTGCDRRGRAVVVNEAFVRNVLGGANAIGRRLRYPCRGEACARVAPAGESDEWYEIVGVVEDVAMNGDPNMVGRDAGGLYHVWAPGDTYWARLAVRTSGDAAAFAPRLREIATAVDPALRLEEVMTLEAVRADTAGLYRFAARVATAASLIVLLLSVAGTYAILAFTVAARTREIGVRTALGGRARSIVVTILSRALAPVLLGVALGGVGVLVLIPLAGGELGSVRGIALPLLTPALMLAVCALACLGPIRRALRVEPTEALRAEG